MLLCKIFTAKVCEGAHHEEEIVRNLLFTPEVEPLVHEMHGHVFFLLIARLTALLQYAHPVDFLVAMDTVRVHRDFAVQFIAMDVWVQLSGRKDTGRTDPCEVGQKGTGRAEQRLPHHVTADVVALGSQQHGLGGSVDVLR